MTKVADLTIYLASCAVKGKKPDVSKIVDLEEIFSFASRHVIGAAVAMALESAGYENELVKKTISFAVRKSVFFEVANKSVLKNLEESGIWYMPLKGAVLKDYYPRFGMREMSDYDILFDAKRADDVKRIMENLGFSTKSFGIYHHDIYYKEPLCNFEMHRKLFEEFEEHRFEVNNKLVKDEGNNYGYHLKPEDFYVYLTAHEYKHYSDRGTGLRSLLDVYVYLKKFEGLLDFDYVSKEIEKLGLSEFEKKNRELSLKLFGNGKVEGDELKMLEYVVNSGVYGTDENFVYNNLKKCGNGRFGKMKYLFTKIFPNIDSKKVIYPRLCKHRIYYPILVIFRLLKAITVKRRKVLRELVTLMKMKSQPK